MNLKQEFSSYENIISNTTTPDIQDEYYHLIHNGDI
jgi:hypothetical protein